MKKVALILIVYVGLFFSFSSVAFSAGMLMMYKITPAEKANVILARLVSGSLPVDSEGGYLIEGSKCTTSNDLLKAVKAHHPETGLVKVDELPTYLKSLQLHPAPEGKFQMSRMKCQEDSGELDLNGWAREFMENERAWFDVNLGRPILAEFCKNVVGQRIDKQSASPDTEPEPLVQGPCGRGRGLIVNIWQFEELPGDLQKQVVSLVRKQKVRDIYWNESVSRTLGRKIRLEMASTASVSGNFQLQHIVTKSGDVEVIDTKPLGSVDIKHDYGHMRVPEAMVKNPHAVHLIAPQMFDG